MIDTTTTQQQNNHKATHPAECVQRQSEQVLFSEEAGHYHVEALINVTLDNVTLESDNKKGPNE